MNCSTNFTKATPPSQFGRNFAPFMAESNFSDGCWQPVQVYPLRSLTLHPGTHALHYASACFEGLKAFRHPDGSLRVFRMDRHVARMRATAAGLHLPSPPVATFIEMVTQLVARNERSVPKPPGSLYLRPLLLGTDVTVGGGTDPSVTAKLIVIASPVVGSLFNDDAEFKVQIVDHRERAVRGIAGIKAAANYASALDPLVSARRECKAQQVLFCPRGDVQESGTSNFFLVDDKALVTKPVNDEFLPGITRESLLVIAGDLGYNVVERDYGLSTLFEWIKRGEAGLCGTAAVVTPVDTFIYEGSEYVVNEGRDHTNIECLKIALTDIQFGRAPDKYGWMSVDVRPGGANGL